MSDGFPSDSCADAVLYRAEVDKASGRLRASPPASGRGHMKGEVRTRCARWSMVVSTKMREGLSMAVP